MEEKETVGRSVILFSMYNMLCMDCLLVEVRLGLFTLDGGIEILQLSLRVWHCVVSLRAKEANEHCRLTRTHMSLRDGCGGREMRNRRRMTMRSGTPI